MIVMNTVSALAGTFTIVEASAVLGNDVKAIADLHRKRIEPPALEGRKAVPTVVSVLLVPSVPSLVMAFVRKSHVVHAVAALALDLEVDRRAFREDWRMDHARGVGIWDKP